jgi:hypothetical protein
VFEPFTIGKYVNHFHIKDRLITLRDKVGVYYQVTSFHGVPLAGRTKIGFKVIHTRSSNIIVGVLLTIRKRLRYSYQQPNMISYKVRGGKYGLYVDGEPVSHECEEVKKGECLWITVDRENNTI